MYSLTILSTPSGIPVVDSIHPMIRKPLYDLPPLVTIGRKKMNTYPSLCITLTGLRGTI